MLLEIGYEFFKHTDSCRLIKSTLQLINYLNKRFIFNFSFQNHINVKNNSEAYRPIFGLI